MEEFGSFIDRMEVVDVQPIGSIFTWIKPNGKACSRLDRILLSEELVSIWGVVAQETGLRNISDHKPVWLKSSRLDWGPKVFKVNSCWFDHKEFKEFVEKEWNLLKFKGSKAFTLKEKFKRLRDKLRWWNTNVFGWVDLKIEENAKDLNSMEESMLECISQITDEVSLERSRKQEELWKNIHYKERILQQKSRTRWVREGDNNTKFFHATLRARYKRNALISVRRRNGEVVETVQEVKEEVRNQFAARFQEVAVPRPSLHSIDFVSLTVAEANSLRGMEIKVQAQTGLICCS
ncbi:uncharacterized protein LOC131642278 [Vicia villosa]|uniref:uncharacterized protein LOC131642278 n=1 Tax=Vicia villosa TaxID=3911 RepID=UPI00273A892B|nr:uncharacterized protein LOC131642278 [Vicia villosa]